jgi:excisionase family DNA binding protein
MNDTAIDDDVLDVREAAALLRMGRNAIYDACGRGELPHRRIGNRLRFSRAALAAMVGLVWSCECARKAVMSVRRDSRTGRWFFRAWVNYGNGRRDRLFGTPGKGDFRDLPNTKVGAQQAEQRAISAALSGAPIVPAAAQEEKTIREHAATFLEMYKPGQKPAERREKRRVMNTHLLPVFGELTISVLTQQHLDKYAQDELGRIGARGEPITIKTVNNQLAVLSTMIKYVTGERSKLRFKLDGMEGEIHAVDPYDVNGLLAIADNDFDLRDRAPGVRSRSTRGEIRGLQHSGDIRGGQVTVRRALDKLTNELVAPKHNKTRCVPLSPRLEAASQAAASWAVGGVTSLMRLRYYDVIE